MPNHKANCGYHNQNISSVTQALNNRVPVSFKPGNALANERNENWMSLKAAADSIISSLKTTISNLTTKEREVENKNREISTLRSSESRLRTNNGTLNRQVTELRERNSQLVRSVSGLDVESRARLQRISQREAELDEVRSKEQDLQEELDQLSAEKRATDTRLASSKARAEELEEKVSAQAQEILQIQAKHQEELNEKDKKLWLMEARLKQQNELLQIQSSFSGTRGDNP